MQRSRRSRDPAVRAGGFDARAVVGPAREEEAQRAEGGGGEGEREISVAKLEGEIRGGLEVRSPEDERPRAGLRRADFETAADLAFELRDADLALSLTSALGTLGFLFACGTDDRARVEAALALTGGALERRLRCMRALAVLLVREGRPADAVQVAAQGLRIAEQANDEAEIARMHTVIFQARLAAGDVDVRAEDLAGAEEYAAQHGERWYEGMLHYYRGVAAFTAGNVVEARSRAERALEAFAASGDLWGIVNASETLGHSLAAVGDYDSAMGVYERALAAGVRDLQEEAVPLLYHYGLSRLRAGDPAVAATAVRGV